MKLKESQETRCHIAVSNPHAYQKLSVHGAEQSNNKPLGNNAFDISQRYNLYSTFEPDTLVAPNNGKKLCEITNSNRDFY